MKTNQKISIILFLLFFYAAASGFNFVYASEITGTLSNNKDMIKTNSAQTVQTQVSKNNNLPQQKSLKNYFPTATTINLILAGFAVLLLITGVLLIALINSFRSNNRFLPKRRTKL